MTVANGDEVPQEITQINLVEIKLELRYMHTDIAELRKEFQAMREGGTLGFEKFHAKIIGGLWTIGGFSSVLLLAVGWLFTEVQQSKETNAVQQQRLMKLEQDLLSHEVRDLSRFMQKP